MLLKLNKNKIEKVKNWIKESIIVENILIKSLTKDLKVTINKK